MQNLAPVITFDGPGGVGKGTIAHRLAVALGWHYLDSGAIYRVVAWAALHKQLQLTDEKEIILLIDQIKVRFELGNERGPLKVSCDGVDVSREIRGHQIAQAASKISSIPAVRTALLQFQRDHRKLPGLVTDGRDMGTVVFPDATIKFYFKASPLERAKRRFNQLKEQGISVSLPHIEHEITERDQRDKNREVAPLRPADDAITIDTTELAIDQVFDQVIAKVKEVLDLGVSH